MNIKFKKLAKYIAVISAVTILLCSLCIPGFADDGEIPVVSVISANASNATTCSEALKIGYGSQWAFYYGILSGYGDYDIYCFNVDSGVYFACESNEQGGLVRLWSNPDNTGGYGKDNSIGGFTGSDYDETTNLYYTWGNQPYITTYEVPTFSNVNDGLLAVRNSINTNSGGTPHQLSLSIPAGNSLVVDISNLSTVEIHASISTEVAHPSSWYTNQYYSFMSGYPSSIGNRPSDANTINWHGYGQTTLFNRYKSFYWNNTVGSSSGFICITNPYASLDEYDQSFNPTIYVTFSEARGYKYYQLTGGISSNGDIGQYSDGTTASGYYDDNTGQWNTTNDDTGLPWTPQEGGGNLITTNSINDWLKTIATQISNFFQGAIGAVTTLVNAGSAFINTLIGLYSWLPAPVYAVLSSALILVITIGVIKVFI